VMSLDTRLRLWEDFTIDRESAPRHKASVFFGKFSTGQSVEALSLAAQFDFDAARRGHAGDGAARHRAPRPRPERSRVLRVGHGPSELARLTMNPDYGRPGGPARRAHDRVHPDDRRRLPHARDGPEQVVQDTGGFYAKTHLFPAQAMTRLRAIGHARAPQPVRSSGRTGSEVKLVGRKGDILAKDSRRLRPAN
jgi:hypothetical protein